VSAEIVEEVEVVDSPIIDGVRVQEHGTTITTVSRDQIEALGARDLAAAVRRVPGLVVSRYNVVGSYGGGQGGAVFVRGHGSGRPGSEITTLVDGIPRFVGIWTHPLLDTLSLDGLESIEVHKSPQPVLLGPLAGFASIDMIPKRRDREGIDGRVVASYGEYSTQEGVARASGRIGEFDFAVSGSQRRSAGHREGSGGRVAAASGVFGWRSSTGWDLSAQIHHTDAYADDPGTIEAPNVGFVPRFDTKDTFTLLKAVKRSDAWTLTGRAYYENGRIDWDETPTQTTITNYDNHGVRLRADTAPWDGGSLIVGIDHDRYGGDTFQRAARPSPPADVEFRNTGLYASLSHRFEGQVDVVPSLGVRWNDSRDFGGDVGYQAGVTFAWDTFEVFANASRAFNLPGVWAAVFWERAGQRDAVRDLDPETIDHLEAGVIFRARPSLELAVTAFRDEVEDALRFLPPPPLEVVNLGAYETEGIEASVSWAPSARLSLFLSGTVLEADPETTPYVPDSTFAAGVRAKLSTSWSIDLDAERVDDYVADNERPSFPPGSPPTLAPEPLVEGFTIVNGRVTWDVPFLGDLDLRLFAQGENLLDEDYEYRPGYPMPGRSLFAGFDLRL
jgi:iron complex outermembrane receptor protein